MSGAVRELFASKPDPMNKQAVSFSLFRVLAMAVFLFSRTTTQFG
jgi:hypothetical protein